MKSFTAKSILPAAASVFATPSVSRRTSLESKKGGRKDGDGSTNHRFLVNRVTERLRDHHHLTVTSLPHNDHGSPNQLTVRSLDAGAGGGGSRELRRSSQSLSNIPTISLPDGTV